MKEIDLKEFDDYSLSEIFNEEELLKFLHSKYGDSLIVCEWFDAGETEEIDLPSEFTLYEQYKTYEEPRRGYSRHPDPRDPDYDGPLHPDDIEWYYTYGANFDDLIEYLRYMYEAEERFFEFFFKTYVYSKEQRQSYINSAIKTNNSTKFNTNQWRRYEGHSYYSAYKKLR